MACVAAAVTMRIALYIHFIHNGMLLKKWTLNIAVLFFITVFTYM